MKKTPFRKLLYWLLPLIVAPLLGYTAWQFLQRSRQQALIQSIYQQQLDSILLSVNQNAWDRLNAWTSLLATMVQSGTGDERRLETELAAFIARYPAVAAAAIEEGRSVLAASARGPAVRAAGDSTTIPRAITGSDTSARATGKSATALRAAAGSDPSTRATGENATAPRAAAASSTVTRAAADALPAPAIDPAALQKVLSDSAQPVARMFALAAQNYIRPLAISWQPQGYTLLLTPLNAQPGAEGFCAALLVDQRRFVEETVAARLRDTSRGLFDFVVRNRRSGAVLYGSQTLAAADFEQTAPLWILPDLELQIKLRGMTLTALAGRQTRINLLFLAAVNVVLLLGVTLLIRNMAREVQLARQKSDFVANVSHELRTPLALIRLYAETLELGRVPDEARREEYYRTIMNESARLTQLINNILDFSRIEAGRKVYHFAEEDLAEITVGILDLYRFHLEQKGFAVQEELASGLARVAVDREAAGLALVNLLDNAVKYSGEVKEIRIKLEPRGRELHLAVTDRGIGIPEAEQQRIFEKFYRIESSLVRSTGGSGLGLALVQHIMAAHGGRVLVESRPGRGSTFTLVFPVRQDALQA
ncbi:MAG TPA: ATP-binding protein [bacterium]|nr:ATP-binding protein [bacterium]